ncbi:MAG: type II toxin-antitoxin system VapB family antitoxin [Stellaceae bacterium]
MRTNIDIDDQLLREALRLTGLDTERAVVEMALRMLIRVSRQKSILGLVGKVHWDGNIDDSRQDSDPTQSPR